MYILFVPLLMYHVVIAMIWYPVYVAFNWHLTLSAQTTPYIHHYKLILVSSNTCDVLSFIKSAVEPYYSMFHTSKTWNTWWGGGGDT